MHIHETPRLHCNLYYIFRQDQSETPMSEHLVRELRDRLGSPPVEKVVLCTE